MAFVVLITVSTWGRAAVPAALPPAVHAGPPWRFRW